MGASGSPAVSIVVVSYDMARVLPRTILSLSPPYQAPVTGGVEILIVDNGSPEPPRSAGYATSDAVKVLAYPRPSPSPVAAVNFGLERARGDIIGVLIDGARLASPGLVAAAVTVCRRQPMAVPATYNHHLGFTHQSVNESNNEAAEEALLARIGWPTDGYRLFEISVPESGSGWPGPILETNALFLTREMWATLRGYDLQFSSPGGGAANPDAFIRALAVPGASLVKIKGEGTFHQAHGGRTSSAEDVRGELKAIGAEYFRIRGRPLAAYRGPAWLYDPRDESWNWSPAIDRDRRRTGNL